MSSQTNLLEAQFKRQPEMVARRVAGEIILVPIKPQIKEDPCLYTLDEIAAFLWEKLEQGSSGEELIEALLCQYSVSREQAVQDVQNFLEELLSIEAIHSQNKQTESK